MARKGNASTAVITSSAQLPIPTTAWAAHFWYRNASAPSTSVFKFPFAAAGVPNGFTNYGFSWSHTSTSFKQAAFHKLSSGSYVTAQIVSTLLANTWYAIGCQWTGTNLLVFLNGAQQASTPAASILTTDTPFAYVFANKNAAFDDGIMAELGYWTNTVLPSSAWAAMAAGASPVEAQRAGLSLCWPLLGDSPEPDYSGNRNAGAVTVATIVPHPGVQTVGFPRPALWIPARAASGTDAITPSLSGGGSLSATLTPLHRFTVALTGAGGLTATVTPLHPITVPLSGAGSLAATLTSLQRLTATLAGSGALTAAVTPLQEIAVPLAGVGSLAATISRYQLLAPALTGAGALTAAVTLYQRFTVSVAGAGQMSASLGPLLTVTVPLAGGGALTATLTPYQRLQVALTGSGSLAATLSQYANLIAALAGAGALTAVISGTSTREGYGIISDRPAGPQGVIIDRQPGVPA
jgi:hypothetical protein